MEQSDLADRAELLEQGVERTVQAAAAQIALQQARQQQHQHAAEHVDLDLLIRPVVLRAQGATLRPLHLAERAFDMVLGAQPAVDLLGHALDTRGTTALDLPVAPAPELPGQFGQAPLALGAQTL